MIGIRRLSVDCRLEAELMVILPNTFPFSTTTMSYISMLSSISSTGQPVNNATEIDGTVDPFPTYDNYSKKN